VNIARGAWRDFLKFAPESADYQEPSEVESASFPRRVMLHRHPRNAGRVKETNPHFFVSIERVETELGDLLEMLEWVLRQDDPKKYVLAWSE
jgi:hypothetical protein